MSATHQIRRPILRYHGGKFRLAPKILALFPPHNIYTEAYGGAASILMQKPRSHAEIYNDMDAEIVNVFRVLRDPIRALALEDLLALTPYARDEFVEAYEETEDAVEQAKRTIVKSFMGFGSDSIVASRPSGPKAGFNARISSQRGPTGFRSQSRRSGTTPARDWSNYSPYVAQFCDRLHGVVIENRQALDVLRQYDHEDALHYVDPPYPMITRQPRPGQYRFEMGNFAHIELSEMLHQVKGAVIVSSYPGELYAELYVDWKMISGLASSSAIGAPNERSAYG